MARPVRGARGIPRAVAVQVPAHGVQLGDLGYLDEAVAVPVVVAYALGVRIHAAELQGGVFARAAEVPRVIIAAPRVHVHVPSGVDAGVVGGRLQLGGRTALRRVGIGVVRDAA